MHTTVSSRRALSGFRLAEMLEPRELFAANLYTLVKSTAMTGTNGTGAQPAGLVMAPNGDLYGTTVTGGKHRYGTVFKISGTAHTLTTVASFSGANGISPRGGLVLDADGDLLGTTTGGGAHDDGTVWEITAASLASTASAITTIHSFAGADGTYPTSGLFPDGSGNFVGYTQGVLGSPFKNRALVFEVSASGSTYSEATVALFATNVIPSGGLTVDSAGDIFGETRNGGTKHFGTVFEILISAPTTIGTRATFTLATDGANPNGTLVLDSAGDLFGTTLGGGTQGDGTIFEIFATASTITTLFNFNVNNGYRPTGALVIDDSGNLFGVTAGGGGNNGAGTLFEWNAATSAETVLYHFRGPATGTTPSGPLIMNSSGQFFGTTLTGGGTPNLGTVFELQPNVV